MPSKFSTRSYYTFAILLLIAAAILSQIPSSDCRPAGLRQQRQGTASAVPFTSRLLGALASEGLTFTTHAADKSNSVFSPDKGKLNILLDGKSVGREEFSIEPTGATWTAKGKSSLQTPDGKSAVVNGTLILNPDGSPASYDWIAQADKTNSAHVTFVNGTAKTTLQMQGAHPFDQENSFGTPRIVVLDNNLYHQYIVLARVYDWARRGTQSFPVLIPQELTPGTISVDWTGAVTAEGKSYEGLKVTTSDIEVILYLDSNHKLIRLEVPSAKVSVVRE
ncbi:MAG TPA: hypothetical protein VGF19_07430 [Candidatus Acidoferrum sp.]|jgi:hypothetical protein